MDVTYHWDFAFLWQYRWLLLKAMKVTALLWLISLTVGMSVGLLIAAARLSPNRLLRWGGRLFTECFRNIPGIVLIFWFFYAIPVLTGMQSSVWLASTIALSLYAAAYCSEIYRSGILAVSQGQWHAASALGMSSWQQFRLVILPQAVRYMIPAFANRAIELIKNTTLASALAVGELLYTSKMVAQEQFRPLEAYTAVALMFTVLILPCSLLTLHLERRTRRERASSSP